MTLDHYIVKLTLAALLGSLIGLEREYHGRPAGLRTHMLVCVGAAMITISGLSIVSVWSCSPSPGSDVSRVVAGVVTGIGFLGAGAIVRTSDFVRGLTTAACIWFVAALGVVIGLGEFILSLEATGIAMLILVFLPFLEDRMSDLKYRDLIIIADDPDVEILTAKCSDIIRDAGITVHDIELEMGGDNGTMLLYHLRIRRIEDKFRLLSDLCELKGVTGVHWKRTVTDF